MKRSDFFKILGSGNTNCDAIHEAAHCIIALTFNLNVKSVTLIPEKININKPIRDQLLNVKIENIENVNKSIIRLIAISGTVAQSMQIKENVKNYPENLLDNKDFTIAEKTNELLNDIHKDDLLYYKDNIDEHANFGEDVEKTIYILNDNWKYVELISEVLIQKKILNHDEIEALWTFKIN